MERYAVVTGAAGGIGKAFCELLIAKGYQLLITGRNEEKLHKLKNHLESLHDTRIECMAADLSIPGEGEKIAKYVEEKKLQVEVLVNNAGYGLTGEFLDRSLSQWIYLNQVNINAVLELTWHLGNQMKRNKSGIIINISSLAAFQAIPWFAAYAASKSYLLSFSEALAEELAPYNIRVTAVCPGATRTDFVVTADAEHVEAPDMVWMEPEDVAKEAWKAVQNKDRVCVPGFVNKLAVTAQKIVPRSWVSKMAGSVYNPSNKN